MSRLLPRPVNVVVLLVLLGLVVRFSTEESVSTRSTRAEGTLMCGKLGASKVYVRLFKTNSDANIDPFLKIYHKCDDKEGKKGYRRITLRYPREYVTIGRVPRRNYNVGNLNLVLQYPNEARIDELKGI
uniref:Transthyretin-like family protein n=1 Tax=Globodera pallida TaxID=36090 RepID=A0A183C5Y1_GLOPA